MHLSPKSASLLVFIAAFLHSYMTGKHLHSEAPWENQSCCPAVVSVRAANRGALCPAVYIRHVFVCVPRHSL